MMKCIHSLLIIGTCFFTICESFLWYPVLLTPFTIPRFTGAQIGASAALIGLKIAVNSGYLKEMLEETKGDSKFKNRLRRSHPNHQMILDTVDALVDSIHQLDSNGCVQKMVCLLQTKSTSVMTPPERAILRLFPTGDEIDLSNLKNSTASYYYAAGIGKNALDGSVCNKLYASCPYSPSELEELVGQAWGCPL